MVNSPHTREQTQSRWKVAVIDCMELTTAPNRAEFHTDELGNKHVVQNGVNITGTVFTAAYLVT